MQNHLSGVNLGYRLPDGSTLFKSLTFSFPTVRTALVGANGIGKTTLLEILVGRFAPSGGSLTGNGRISYLPQTVQLDHSATVAEVINQADALAAYRRAIDGEASDDDFDLIADRWDLPERIEQTFAKLGVAHISLDRAVGSLSGGELTRVRIAGLLLAEPDFLILDEPTNHLDLSAREFVYELISDWKRGLIVVSHDRRLLSLVDQIAELNANGLKMYGGNFDFYLEQRNAERAAAEQTLASAAQRLKDARATAQRARERQQHRQATANRNSSKQGLPKIVIGNLKQSAEKTSSRLKGRHQEKIETIRDEVAEARGNLTIENRIKVDLNSSEIPAHKRMIELLDVNYRFTDADQTLWPSPLNIEIIGPERVWLKGANGAGKSTLIDLICGRKQSTTGTVRLGSTRIALLDQQTSALDQSLSVLENLQRVAPLRPEHELRTLLGRFLFIRDDALKPVAALSGGERMRAALACLLGADQSPEILIVDEPTNNLDLPSIEALVSALNQFRGVLIAASHDAAFVDDIGVEREIELRSQGCGILTAIGSVVESEADSV